MSASHAPVTPIRQPQPAAPQSPQQLVEERAQLKADVDYIQEQIAAIDAQLVEQLPVGTHDVAGVKVQVREYTRLDTEWLEREYPREHYPQLYKTTTAVDNTAVKKQFAPAVLDEHQVRGAKSIVIR